MAMEPELRKAVEEAAGRAEVSEAVGRIYRELQAEIDRRRPVCVVSGRCCRFEEYGHRLYVTTLELAAFMAGLKELSKNGELGELSTDPGSCPFQIKKLCGVHAIRPFGCRVFFCDASATDWQHEQYEKFHARLRALHEELGVPYFYMEWRAALEELGLP